jgi:hypothetical protein
MNRTIGRVVLLFVSTCLLHTAWPASAQQCPTVSLLGPPPGDLVHSACSEAEARRAANQALVAQCKENRASNMPCVGSCDQLGRGLECTLFADSLSYDLICSPAEVDGCKDKDDPHACFIIPKAGGEIRCSCNCARNAGKKEPKDKNK